MRAFVLVLLFFATLGFAQDDFGIPSVIPKELTNGRFQMVGPHTARYMVEVIDTLNPIHEHPVLPLTYKVVNISTDAQASWTPYTLNLLSGNTYYYDFVAPVAGASTHYYFQVGTDSTFSSQAPTNSAETFPPPANRMANIHNDPTGDQLPVQVGTTNHTWGNIDLVNFKMGYSASKIYVQITTNGGFNTSHNSLLLRTCGSWPLTFNQTVDVYHLYAAPIINPQAEFLDSIFYAVIYGNMNISFLGIGIVITPGVYKIVKPGEGAGISDYLSAYTKISGASTYGYNISGNVLNMWFSPSILTSDPDFGPLPADNLFYTGAGIASAYMMQSSCSELVADTFVYVVNDFSNNTAFYMSTLSGTVLDIVEAEKPSELELYTFPNPFNSSVSIRCPEDAVVEIFDFLGRPLDRLEGGERTWVPSSDEGSGIYFARATRGCDSITKRLLFIK